jgi:hypothetical protein
LQQLNARSTNLSEEKQTVDNRAMAKPKPFISIDNDNGEQLLYNGEMISPINLMQSPNFGALTA